ncbi:TrkH family potassium uptake protein [Rhizobium halophytocola]|uniref:Trk system potassium uptake protein n=1 Tax=Rhizobium halophytocola TaxID=735519 RepID=A0ABS4DVU3_9HYPH|nr:TrkH family potassium uptake protein [Rhizobium halophytocola]MBP1849816.1 trk system potassium uptake protein TrkH [Rhizobium halophytocola]
MNASQLRSAIYIAALCGLYLSTAMLVPVLVDVYYGHKDWKVFAVCAFMVGGLSMTTAMATRSAPPTFNKRMGFILVNVLWATFSLVGSVPLYFSGQDMTFAQALFESISAITTTGSTVLSGLDHMPPGLLVWRSMLQWLGGIGIVALGLFVLPFLRVGGVSFFKMESSDTNDKPFARLATFTRAFVGIYVGFTVLCTISYDVAGMSHFDAINHALTTVATGGFSTHDASFGYFHNTPLLWISTFFMTVCSLPFSILIVFVVRGRLDALRDPQIGVFLLYLLFFAVTSAIYNHFAFDIGFGPALTHGMFNFASILSTTGYASQDYTSWGPFVVVAAFVATFIGGCSGSTAGGIKAYRLVIMAGVINTGLKKLIYPNAIYSVRYGRQTVDIEMQRTVFLFFSTYMLLWALGSMIMAALGYDFATATSSVITALSNVGPGVGDLIGPSGNFATMQAPELYLLSLMMLLGRLEVLSVLVVLLPTFWRS